ncbi:MAG: YciI family protein [Pseudomonadota bacterium]
MRFIITAGPGDTKSETNGHLQGDAPFDEAMFAAYMKFNEDMLKAGVLVTSEGINPGAQGARIGVAGGKRTVLDGPFTETKELLGGFYIVDVKSLDDAIAWALRCPVGLGTDNLLEIRPLTAMTDIPPHLLELSAAVAPTWTASVTGPGR